MAKHPGQGMVLHIIDPSLSFPWEPIVLVV